MRLALGIGLVLACCACSAESRLQPRTPVNAQQVDPTCVAAPAIQDSVPQVFAESQLDDPYRVERPHHIDLGYIGDSPIGLDPGPPHVDPPWEQPFTLDEYEYGVGRWSCPMRYAVPALVSQ